MLKNYADTCYRMVRKISFKRLRQWGFAIAERVIGLNSEYKEKWEFIAKEERGRVGE